MQRTLTAVYNAMTVLYLGARTASAKRMCVPVAIPTSRCRSILYSGVITKLSRTFHLVQESDRRYW